MHLTKTIEISNDIKTELLQSLFINQPKSGYSSGALPIAMEQYFKKIGRVDMRYTDIPDGRKLVDTGKCYVYLNENEIKQYRTKISLSEIINQLVIDCDITCDKIHVSDIDGNKIYINNNIPHLSTVYIINANEISKTV